MNHLYFVTGNSGKFSEVSGYVARYAPYIEIEQSYFPLVEIQDDSQESIARHKASQAYEALKKPVLVDDSGIFFERYNQFPGVYTKFVYDSIGLEGLLRLTNPGDRATFRLVLVYQDAEGQQVFEGSCSGIIQHDSSYHTQPGFPYDALFRPDGSGGKTFAQLRIEGTIDLYNYRIGALKKFISWYEHHRPRTDKHSSLSISHDI